MIPERLNAGDEVRVISPSKSMSLISREAKQIANKRFEDMGLEISFSDNVSESNKFNSSSIKSRINDLHEAFEDKNVKGIITTIGGFNSSQLLKYIDFDLIKNNPKVFCGYSDITALQNAILAKTGLVTYSGPHYSTFGMKKGFDYTLDYFKKCLMENSPFDIVASKEWSDDSWFLNQEKRKFVKNSGYQVFSNGDAKGEIVGGNLCTLNLLQGTEFMPSLKNKILFIEDDEETNLNTFDRDLQSLIHQPDFESVKAMVIGRFQNASEMNLSLLKKNISTKKELKNIPIIANVDFGHTSPMVTFPIGGKAVISTKNKKIEIIKH
ncbi:MAG: LD-carboxypeptidase [Candidatus Diapherotrites archaeon]|jgi:muramoyltetrapeptide carboxypeptidase|uniref:LD-carboxypeptidase n=1 Tax=Candidatus Iainarchaeum sp. TaxID=3101447 RepID=A0A8T5GG20_9ARCH|nr:LD-carboxypeptidase [Candidatus Diapherotrites archaeon]